jgi:hypothetical protein
LGIQWRLEAYRNHWSAISPYYDNLLDSLSLLPELEPDRVRVVPTDAETAGVELSARYTFASNVDVRAAYALSRTTDDLDGHDVPRSWDQPHAASLGVAWRGAYTAVSAVVSWHSGWPRTPLAVLPATATMPASLVVGARHAARWSNYATADLRFERVLPLAYGELSVWLDATNMTDRPNECCTGFAAGDVAMPLSITKSKTWLPRIVNLGVTWRLRSPR